MSPPQWIEIDAEVLALIKADAEPFVDSPNDVLRRTYGLQARHRPSCSLLPSPFSPPAVRPDRRRWRRAQTGELLPMAEYELPLLRALSQLGGSAPRERVAEAVLAMLDDRLTDSDRAALPSSGEIRWQSRLGFARLKAVDRGHLRGDTPRGIWELSEAGIKELGRLEAAADATRRAAR